MESKDLEILSGFGAVWERVMGGASCPLPEAGPAFIEQVMDCLCGLRRGYRQLARHSRGGVRCSLQELAGEAKEAFRRLQLAYFLETGELYHPSENENFASCTMSNLRKLWKNAFDLLQMLQSYPGDARNPYGEELAAVEKLMSQHKDRLKCIIGEIMG